MSWNMFIDDERFPANDGKEWVICRNKLQVMHAVSNHHNTLPNYISFDHDLGYQEATGYDIVKWLIESHMDNKVSMPSDFSYYVHSQNPIGKLNIERYLENYMKILKT